MRFSILLVLAGVAFGQTVPTCPRPLPGATITPPAELHSANGKLRVDFSLRTMVDVYGLTLYCYITGDSAQSPTLRVQPGDEVILHLRNELPAAKDGASMHEHMAANQGACVGGLVSASSTNLHFHGLDLPPICHQDDVIHTLVQPGAAPFEYRFQIPLDEHPGLYWYHPHPHGFSERQVLGGASGALIVEGIERAAPAVAGLPERVLLLRDQLIGGVAEDSTRGDGDEPYVPSRDLSINYVPILYPLYKPSVMPVRPNQREFWRVLNASADTFFSLQLLYWPNADSQVPQPMRVIAIDGVPVGSDFAGVERTSLLLPPGARVEFLMTTPPLGMYAQFLTQRYDNGLKGDVATYRVLANLVGRADAPEAPGRLPGVARPGEHPFQGLTALRPVRERTLYFSEKVEDPKHPKQKISYFLTADGDQPKPFDMNFKKADLTAVQGSVEDWTIENRAEESHVFHIHQLHFQLLERDGQAVQENALRDTVDLPFWNGKPGKYPSVKVRIDFRNPSTIGTFLYHCHIMEHEDGGMMGSIEVTPAADRSVSKDTKASTSRQ